MDNARVRKREQMNVEHATNYEVFPLKDLNDTHIGFISIAQEIEGYDTSGWVEANDDFVIEPIVVEFYDQTDIDGFRFKLKDK